MSDTLEGEREELIVTFNPPLYLQRQRWLLSVLTRERVRSVSVNGTSDISLIN